MKPETERRINELRAALCDAVHFYGPKSEQAFRKWRELKVWICVGQNELTGGERR